MLIDCVTKKRKIEFDGGEFELRALCLRDVSWLVVNHREAVDKMAVVVRARTELNMDDIGTMIEVVSEMIQECPSMAADLISACADEPEAFSVALTLPVVVQVEALRTIGELTFEDGIAIKKLWADVKRLLSGILPPRVAAAA
jgi:hypothetical protein